MHALVGANNAGKSNILRALDFLFNPSATKINEEAFWNGDTTLQIWIEAVFSELTDQEVEKLNPYLCPDGNFHVARSAKIVVSEEADEQEDSDATKVVVSQHYCKPMPIYPWLRDTNINGKNIDEWWAHKEELQVRDESFAKFVEGKKPNVGQWKDKAKQFVEQQLITDDYEDTWADNPQGYAGVLKGTLPRLIYIPAVRDLSEESKVTKNNPFGRLLYSILDSVTEDQKTSLGQSLSTIQNKLNRIGGAERLGSIVEIEAKLNDFLKDYMLGEVEIEFQTPTLEILLTTPKLFADDGFRNTAENKGHGLQRAIIFSILRCYSESAPRRTVATPKRSTIFAIEEPEIYMHPQAQRTIRRVLQDIAKGKDQIIFATHSSLLLDVACFDEIIRVEAIREKSNGTKFKIKTKVWQLAMSKMIKDIETRHPHVKGKVTNESMRELYSHAYHPTRSEGFFAKKVILVEGPTEQYSLPIYAEALGHPLDKLNISVVDCGGKGPMDRLYRIFNELGIPCYILLDYDVNSTDKEIIKKSRELLMIAGENLDAHSGTFIGEQIACFRCKWETDLANEIPNIGALTTEARQLLGLSDDCGKPLVARYIARKLTDSKPPFIPPSIDKIIKKAAKVEWKESCLK